MRKSYPGLDVVVSFDPEACEHSGNCVRGLPTVFDTNRRPWIAPDEAGADEVRRVVATCPSGALQIEPPA